MTSKTPTKNENKWENLSCGCVVNFGLQSVIYCKDENKCVMTILE